ncbi:hypothetical protein [Kitasatospora kifunensis]|uniref:Uncharacterized protein n=1 Tax=Kitasatospora kifunensis TaxID=58351 RepID=A0A7W7VTF5_KITKI|nr:hypothetical protein [Kitasatospora kifunensis]MBB4922182.1 hypothetical protein [Kitasatospora kifunensis]
MIEHPAAVIWRWSAPWLDARLDGVCAGPEVVLLERAAAISKVLQETAYELDGAMLYGWRQRLRDEGWSGWLLDLDMPVLVAPAKAKSRRRR